MSQQAEILLVTWDGAGNLAPERTLVRRLIARGHRVRALAHDSVRETLERDGVECLPLRGTQPYDSKRPMPPSEEMSFVVDHIWYARPFGEELLAAVERHRPDLLLVDISLTYAMVAAQRSGLPTAVLGHFPYSLQRLCDALGRLEVEALVTTGAAIRPDELRAAANTTVTDFVAHDRVLPAADLLVTHAGHGTVMAGATYGVPMLCYPMGRDQPMNAARVAELGIGATADAEASVAEIERAIASTLADATIRARARAFAASLADHRGLDDAVRLVETLLTTRAR